MNHLIDSDNGSHQFSPRFNGLVKSETLTENQIEYLIDERNDIRNGEFNDFEFAADRLLDINNKLKQYGH